MKLVEKLEIVTIKYRVLCDCGTLNEIIYKPGAKPVACYKCKELIALDTLIGEQDQTAPPVAGPAPQPEPPKPDKGKVVMQVMPDEYTLAQEYELKAGKFVVGRKAEDPRNEKATLPIVTRNKRVSRQHADLWLRFNEERQRWECTVRKSSGKEVSLLLDRKPVRDEQEVYVLNGSTLDLNGLKLLFLIPTVANRAATPDATKVVSR
jgi:hypothetical protein